MANGELSLNIQEFFNKEFKAFSNLDNVRSIPSVIDGFKDAQRKAVYGLFCHGDKEIKVAQLGSSASLVTHYAHGEVSMCNTIVGLAQNFPGSNNVNLFEPIGQFGSILSPVASAHRYIYTKPSQHLREYIRKEDDCILRYKYEDGDRVEPEHYLPILPFWLLNGAVGVGTGHSVKVAPRCPAKAKKALELIMKGSDKDDVLPLLEPHLKGWTGVIRTIETGKYQLQGRLIKENLSTIIVEELPYPGIDKFKAVLVDLMNQGKVKDFDNNSSEEGIKFTIKVPRDIGRKSEFDLILLFKLNSQFTENVTLWDIDGNLKKYDDVYEALFEFAEYRLEKFSERIEKHIAIQNERLIMLTDKMLFIKKWNEFDNPGKMKIEDIRKVMIDAGISEENFDSLIGMNIRSLTEERIIALEGEVRQARDEIKRLKGTTAKKEFMKEISKLK